VRDDPFAAAGDAAPALLRSGFAVVAAVDSSDVRRRAAGRYVLDVDHGGATARILVATDLQAGDERTPDVLHRMQELAGVFAAQTGEQVGVGGFATTLTQFDEGTSERLPFIMLGVVLVTFLVLVAVLRSVLLPLLAVALNVLTVLATFGVLSLLFVGDDPLLGRTGALDVIGVCTIFAITFALSIDYQVFLLARMREGFVMTQDPVEAIRFGISHTARIVTGAALIMLGVFAAFATTDIASVQQFGVGLGFAILADATLVRLVLLPAVMRLAGDSTWWLPDRLERRLPELDVEGVGYVRTQSQLATRAADVW
jgi:RND superfamily putative drug exporter